LIDKGAAGAAQLLANELAALAAAHLCPGESKARAGTFLMASAWLEGGASGNAVSLESILGPPRRETKLVRRAL